MLFPQAFTQQIGPILIQIFYEEISWIEISSSLKGADCLFYLAVFQKCAALFEGLLEEFHIHLASCVQRQNIAIFECLDIGVWI